MNNTQARVPRTMLGTALSTLALAVFGSFLWDFLFKPGITHFGRTVMSIITFGSESIRDSAYSSAALDPTPVPSLLFVMLLAVAPMSMTFSVAGHRIASLSGKRAKERIREKANGDTELATELLRRRRAKLNLVKWANVLVMVFASLIAGLVVNQSVVVWRVFNANMRICAPYISDTDEKKMRASFTKMKTRRDFEALTVELEKIAKANGVELVSYETW